MRVRGSYAEGYKEQNMKTIVMGILAHVDAGKTTLSEAMLYESGVIRSIGRVDKGNTYLERDNQERERGITIFSKQAVLPVHEDKLILLDTPGHVDFSAEAERTLQVLDLAVLVVSAADGVQGHTMTLWKLLSRYHIPVFLFVNKRMRYIRSCRSVSPENAWISGCRMGMPLWKALPCAVRKPWSSICRPVRFRGRALRV